ncbi:MAG: Na+/H+ antiporter NhaA [Alphaproteobacteria bacterium]|nr:MAG: Na+/H+ antiporter NhaA [Alphaproteobacteria bacterium]
MKYQSVKTFIHNPKNVGLLLTISTIIALVWQNSPWRPLYTDLFSAQLSLPLGVVTINKSVSLWINDGLMAVFFLHVGLEIKRELLQGELNSFKKALLPAIGAMGGLIIPIVLYKLFVDSASAYANGWAIPAATDIAFALALLSLVSSKVPQSLKIILLAMAIIDDIAAVIIIAFFYTPHLDISFLLWAIIPLFGLWTLNRRGIGVTGFYIPLGFLLWVLILKSGIHATLAGIMFAFFIPIKANKQNKSMLITLEKKLHVVVMGFILPLFALANAGIPLTNISIENLTHPMTYGIMAGLFFGSQIGVFGSVRIAKLLGVCTLPDNIRWSHFYGLSALMGIGFTMSLFIANLSFTDPDILDRARLSILLGSSASAILGYSILKLIPAKARIQY